MLQFVSDFMASFVSPLFIKWVIYVYAAEERIDQLPVLYRRIRATASVDPSTAWETLEIARSKQSLSAGVVLLARADLDHVNNLCERNAGRWEELELDIYVGNQKEVFDDIKKSGDECRPVYLPRSAFAYQGSSMHSAHALRPPTHPPTHPTPPTNAAAAILY